MKKFLCIAMALVFVLVVVPAMAADICPLKSALPEADTSIVQMTNNELSAVRGGWGTLKRVWIDYSSPSTTTSATAISTSSGQVNNVNVNTGTESLVFDSQSEGGGFHTLFIRLKPSLQVVEATP